jgi:hypothetical protein
VDRSFWFALCVMMSALGPVSLAELPLGYAQLALVALARELGSALVLLAFGHRPRIILSWTGGETRGLRATPRWLTLLAELAGPGMLLALSLATEMRLAAGWALVSLLPIPPLPGGRVMMLLSRRVAPLVALPIALGVVLVAIRAGSPGPALLIILGVGVVVNLRRAQFAVWAEIAERLAATAPPRRRAELLAEVFEAQPSDHAAAQLAHSLVEIDRLDDATRLLDDESAGPQLFTVMMAALFFGGRLPEAAHVGERSWAIAPAPLTAFNLACTRARMEEPEVAISWLDRALDAGWRDLQQLDEDPDLVTLRTRPDWAPLRARLTSLGRT